MERTNKRTNATSRNVAKDIISCVFALLECTDDELDYLGFITTEEFEGIYVTENNVQADRRFNTIYQQ